MKRIILLTSLLFIYFLNSINAQDNRIKLSNPSFEDSPRAGRVPSGWFDCGMKGESPPDTQPGVFDVNYKAHDGGTYLGMVTRDNETWEAVAQRLSSTLKSGNCYQFNIYLTYSDEYFSISRLTKDRAFFTQPILLRIWGGDGYCDKKELLGSSELVDNTNWTESQFILKPEQDYKFIILEAYYKTPTLFPYNGNILLDNASDIVLRGKCEADNPEWIAEIMSEEDKKIAANQPKPKPKPIVKKQEPKPTPTPKPSPLPKAEIKEPTQPVVVPDPVDKKPKLMETLANPLEIKKGQNIRIEQLDFEANDYKISRKMYPALNEIHSFMLENPKVIIEIGGHTNGRPPDKFCNELSENRATTVANYLIGKGIDKKRIAVKGYGKTVPIATNETEEGRKKNQRVEIKILSLEG